MPILKSVRTKKLWGCWQRLLEMYLDKVVFLKKNWRTMTISIMPQSTSFPPLLPCHVKCVMFQLCLILISLHVFLIFIHLIRWASISFLPSEFDYPKRFQNVFLCLILSCWFLPNYIFYFILDIFEFFIFFL